jgi:hypothetical protein
VAAAAAAVAETWTVSWLSSVGGSRIIECIHNVDAVCVASKHRYWADQ